MIHLNDADPKIADFWWSLLHRTHDFLELLADVPLSVEEWNKQREIYRGKTSTERLLRGFATFYLNRCNRSGIIMNGGPIGGIDQSGKWKIDARFNKTALQARCRLVAEYKDRINISCRDGMEVIRSSAARDSLLFIDPPYYHKGNLLYLNYLSPDYHRELAELLFTIQDMPWVLTYDDCPEIRALYEDWATVRPFELLYSATRRRQGTEVLIVPRNVHLPISQISDAISW